MYFVEILQDRVLVFLLKKVREFIVKEFGVFVDIFYKEFEDQLIVVVSFGQVRFGDMSFRVLKFITFVLMLSFYFK